MKKRIIHLLDAGLRRQALKGVEAVFRIAGDSMAGIKIFTDYGIDIFEAVPMDSRLGELFISRRYPQMREILDTKRIKTGKYRMKP